MISQKIIQTLLEYISIKPFENVALIYDSTTKEIAESLYEHIFPLPKLINLDLFSRPLNNLPLDLQLKLNDVDFCFYLIEKQANLVSNELYFRNELNLFIEQKGGRVGNMLSVTAEMLEVAFNISPLKILHFTKLLKHYMSTVKKVLVTTPSGTNVIFEFNSKYNWVESTGFIEKGKTRNVMPAEIETYPSNVTGKIVISGIYGFLGSLKTFKDPLLTLKKLKKTPIMYDVENGRITLVTCADKEIEEIVKYQVFESSKNSDRIGEFGMGTNLGLTKFFGVMMIDEKVPGIHIAHGDGYSKGTNCPYVSKTHYDGVLINPTVINLDTGKTIIKDGKYNLKEIGYDDSP